FVAQDAGVVDDDVELAELVQRAPDQAVSALAASDAVVVGHRVAPRGLDLGDHLVRHFPTSAAAVAVAAEVVDHHFRAFAREEQSVLAADAATRTGDDRDFSVEESHRRRASSTGSALAHGALRSEEHT